VTGLTDWKHIDKGARRTGLLHAMLNTVALSLYVCSGMQRRREKRDAARMLAYLGFGVTMASSWLGGHLSYADRIGVARVPDQEPPRLFKPVLAEAQLQESKPTRVDCAGYPITLVKKGAEIFAISDICTHMSGPLSEGKVEHDCIRCPWHGSLFSLKTGEVVEGPAIHPIAAFETRVLDGQIEVRLAAAIPAAIQ
jgi:nitrite reductase/ring-hydroxylating ferredoxin subunit